MGVSKYLYCTRKEVENDRELSSPLRYSIAIGYNILQYAQFVTPPQLSYYSYTYIAIHRNPYIHRRYFRSANPYQRHCALVCPIASLVAL